tara:strand:- start:114 stop:731 length:618 start_codon:yes stop_codon:yes gene_type:complete
MEEFFQDFTFNEGITILISSFALLISIIGFLYMINNDKRQLRIGRIEEIIEIIHVLMGNYRYFDDTFFLQQDLANKINEDEDEIKRLLNSEKRQVEALEKISNDIELQQKLIRLTVLINAYLPNKRLKNKLRSYVGLYTSIAETTLNRNYQQTKVLYSTYPRPWILLPFIEKCQIELIREMKLGYENNIYSENPFEKEFKKELNI